MYRFKGKHNSRITQNVLRIGSAGVFVLLICVWWWHSSYKVNSVIQVQGPLTTEELGKISWPFLHTFAATIPSRPSIEEQQEIKQFMIFL
jgi:hypothetical protein